MIMAKEIINRGIKHTLVPASASYANHCTKCSLKQTCGNTSFLEALIECEEDTMYAAI